MVDIFSKTIFFSGITKNVTATRLNERIGIIETRRYGATVQSTVPP